MKFLMSVMQNLVDYLNMWNCRHHLDKLISLSKISKDEIKNDTVCGNNVFYSAKICYLSLFISAFVASGAFVIHFLVCALC